MAVLDESAVMELQRIQDIRELPELQSYLQHIHDWNIDVFDMADKAQNNGLTVTLIPLA